MQPLQIEQVATQELRPNPWNSNVVAPEMEARLRESVKRFGLYKPIVTRRLPDGSQQILGGEHRWRVASDLKFTHVPVVCLGEIDDKRAKLIGLADNGGYGMDDSARLNAVLQDIGADDVAAVLPYTDDELNSLFRSIEIDLSKIGFDDEIDDAINAEPVPLAERPAKLTELMRFKVPVADRENIERLLKKIIVARGFDQEEDSMLAAGMALVELANVGKEHFA